MSAGLFGLLDDVAALARLAAASVDDIGAAAGRATAKAAGVVIDDTAVTPQYVHGITADRELPMIKRIAIGSLRNKLVFILPAALLLSQFAPWLVTPILMLGATYLCYEGAEKVWGWIRRTRRPCRTHRGRRRGRREADDRGRDPDRLHPVRRDHGDRAQRGGRPVVLAALHHSRRGRLRHHRRRVRRGRPDREDGRHRIEPRAAHVTVRAEDRPRSGRRDAQTAVGAVDHRHGRDALGRRPHSARRNRRRRLARAVRPCPSRRRVRPSRRRRASAACSPGW